MCMNTLRSDVVASIVFRAASLRGAINSLQKDLNLSKRKGSVSCIELCILQRYAKESYLGIYIGFLAVY